MYNSKLIDKTVTDILANGGVGVAPTDTVYGFLAQAKNKQAVERVYSLRKRSPDKPCIILLSEADEMIDFGVSKTDVERSLPYWPAPITLIFKASNQPAFLNRGKPALAFRLPDNKALRKLIKKAGPLIAPSANPEGEPTAKNVNEVKEYFAGRLDFCVGSNKIVDGFPSTILDMTESVPRQIR